MCLFGVQAIIGDVKSGLDNYGKYQNLEKLSDTSFDPWGVVLNGINQSNGFQNRFEFQGKEKESTFPLNRINLGARTINPTIGRFDSVDIWTKENYAIMMINTV